MFDGIGSHKLRNCTTYGEFITDHIRFLPEYKSDYTNTIISSKAAGQPINAWRNKFYNKIPKADSCCCCYCYISTLTKCRTYSFRIGVSYYHSLRTGTSNLVPRLRGDNQVWGNLVTLGSQKKVVPVIIDTKVISFLVISNKPFFVKEVSFCQFW